jgi:hypothetical protein
MIPKSVRIGAHNFEVVMVGKNVSDDCGRCDVTVQKIFIREDLAISVMWETLIHEVVHIIRILSGLALADYEAEERVVQAESHFLYLFVKDNPKLLEEIIACNEVQII